MRLTLYRKMLLGFGLIILVLVAVNAYILFQLNVFSATVNTILASDVQSIEVAKALSTSLYEEERHAQKFIVSKDSTYAVLFAEAARHSSEQIRELLALPMDADERDIVSRIQRGHTALTELVVYDARTPAFFMTEGVVSDSMDALHASLDRFIGLNKAMISNSMSRLDDATSESLRLGLLLTLVAILGTIAVAFFITRSITRPVRILRNGTERIARGIFAPIQVPSHDEIAELASAFNQMSEKLKKINDMKAEMLQQISHEIRMPLQGMHSAYYLLANQIAGPATAEQLKLLGSIRTNIDRIAEFSNQFLDLSKIEAGMMKFHAVETDLNDLAEAAMENARLAGAEKDITVTLTRGPVPKVYVDPDKVTQVITNFLSNAIKYTPPEGRVSITLSPCSIGARVSVTDTGVGIDAEDLPKLFTKFYQARNKAKASSRGTGLGLALVKAIVQQHGGRVYATSTPGLGSTFSAEFPARKPAGARRTTVTKSGERVPYERP
jgi:two-component system sensor histidine kinase GlrK